MEGEIEIHLNIASPSFSPVSPLPERKFRSLSEILSQQVPIPKQKRSKRIRHRNNQTGDGSMQGEPSNNAPDHDAINRAINREASALFWEGEMEIARSYVEGKRQVVAAMEVNLQSEIAAFLAWDKEMEDLGWNMDYESAVADYLKNDLGSNLAFEAQLVMDYESHQKRQSILHLWHSSWEEVSQFAKNVTRARQSLNVGEDLLQVLEEKKESHVSAFLQQLTGPEGITSEISFRISSFLCVCGDPTCFFPIRAWRSSSE